MVKLSKLLNNYKQTKVKIENEMNVYIDLDV